MTYLQNLAYLPIAFDNNPNVITESVSVNAKAINSGIMNWANDTVFVVDVTISNQLLMLQNIQSMFVDNNNSGALVVTVSNTGATYRVAPYSQATLPLIASDRPVFTFTNSAGSGTTQVWLSNVPTTLSVVSSTMVSQAQYSGNVTHPNMVANLAKLVTLSSSSTTITTGNPGYYVTSIELSLDPNATLASAGILQINANDSSFGNFYQWRIYVPNSAPSITSPTNSVVLATQPNFFFNNKTANSSLLIGLATGLSAGTLTCNVNYGLCNFIG